MLEVGEAFAFRRVDDASMHAAAIADGSLAADEVDDTRRLEAWLLHRLREADERATDTGGRGRIDLAGAWPLLRPGGRLIDVAGAGRTADDRAEAVGRHGALVHALRCRFDLDDRAGATTRIDVTW